MTIETPHNKGATRRAVWHPKVLRFPATLALSLLLLSWIVALEIFIRLSRKREGFPEPSSTVRGVLTYAPVVTLILLDFYWKSHGLEIKKLAPWAQLCRKSDHAENTVLLDYVGANYIAVIFRAMKRGHWHVLLSIIGSGFVALMVVVATSLWEIKPHEVPQRTLVLQHTSSLEGGSFNGESNTAYLTRYFGNIVYNLSSPNWIAGPYALSSFRATEGNLNPGIVSAKMTAYSGELDCEDMDVSYLRTIDRGFTPLLPLASLVWQVEASWKGCKQTLNLTHPSYMFCTNNVNTTEATNLLKPGLLFELYSSARADNM